MIAKFHLLMFQQKPIKYDKNTYILATDADMLFTDAAVLDLVNVCNDDVRLGAACGRTHPMGKKINPIVWYQIFEYAKGECIFNYPCALISNYFLSIHSFDYKIKIHLLMSF